MQASLLLLGLWRSPLEGMSSGEPLSPPVQRLYASPDYRLPTPERIALKDSYGSEADRCGPVASRYCESTSNQLHHDFHAAYNASDARTHCTLLTFRKNGYLRADRVRKTSLESVPNALKYSFPSWMSPSKYWPYSVCESGFASFANCCAVIKP